MAASGVVYDIKRFAIHDGPGIRTTVFLKGCPLDCWWCHNPESRSASIAVQPDHPLRKSTDLASPDYPFLGKEVTADEIMDVVLKDAIFFDESGGGVTFSGGEPLAQYHFILELLEKSKENGLHTVVDTTGYVPEEHLLKAAQNTDLFLYDIKLFDDALHQKYTGVSNALILQNLRKLWDIGADVIIRIPLIPDITDNDENLTQIIRFLNNNHFCWPVEVLSYNPIGEAKYERLEMPLRSGKKQRQTEDRMNEIYQLIENAGLIAVKESS